MQKKKLFYKKTINLYKYFLFNHKNVFLLFLLMFWWLNSNTFAQTACFTADKTRGCVPLTINLTDCSGTLNPVLIAYKYSETEGFVDRTTNTYTQPGRYTITQIVQVTTRGDSIRKINYIEVLPAPAPIFNIKNCANQQVSLDIPDLTYEQYEINWGDGSPTQTIPKNSPPITHTYNTFSNYSVTITGKYIPGGCGGTTAVLITPISTLPKPSPTLIHTPVKATTNGKIILNFESDASFLYDFVLNGTTTTQNIQGTGGIIIQTFDNIDTETQSLCFQIKAKDVCGNENISDNFFCNQTLKVTAQNNQNIIEWRAYPSSNIPPNAFERYTLFRNGQAYQVFTDINQTQYIDTDVQCRVNYCYELIADFSNATLDFSVKTNQSCVESFSTLPPPIVNSLNSTIDSDYTIRIFWEVPTLPRITSYKIDRNGEILTNETPTKSIIDTDLRMTKQFCYRIQYTNECGNTSAFSSTTCPVFLKGNIITQGNIQLSWTHYQNSDNYFEDYIVEKLDADGNVYAQTQLFSNIINFLVDTEAKNDRQIMRYRIKTVIDKSKNLYSYSNIIEIKQKFKIFFPNAFAPEGLNATFAPKALFVKTYKMVIFNRLGEEVFSTRNIEEGWNGTAKGNPAPADTYVYVVELEDTLGETFATQGTFLLIR